MTATYRLVITCDENLSPQCVGLVEYSGPDRFSLNHATNTHAAGGKWIDGRNEKGYVQGYVTKGMWLQGWSAKGSYDVCPACRPEVERRMKEEEAKQKQPDPAA